LQPVIFQIPFESTGTQPSKTATCITIAIPEAPEKLLSKGPYPAIDLSEGCRIRVVDKGCIISRGPIPRGALIIRERPLIIAMVMTFPRNIDRTVARAMPPNERISLLSPNNCYGDKVIGSCKRTTGESGHCPDMTRRTARRARPSPVSTTGTF